MKIYMIQTYCYNTFSYTGIEIYDQNYFDTEQKAVNWANEKGLEFLSNHDLAFDHKNCNHYTLHEIIAN